MTIGCEFYDWLFGKERTGFKGGDISVTFVAIVVIVIIVLFVVIVILAPASGHAPTALFVPTSPDLRRTWRRFPCGYGVEYLGAEISEFS